MKGEADGCFWHLIQIEGQQVRVMLDFDLESFPCPALSFKREGVKGDPFEDMAGWSNPVAAMRAVMAAAQALCADANLTEVSFAPYCEKRLSLYVRMAKRAGMSPRMFQWSSGDIGVVCTV